MQTHPLKQRAVLPQDRQTGLPAGIYFQPIHVGGSLGFAGKAQLEPMWDKLDAEAQAAAAAAADAGEVPGRGRRSYLQTFNNFLFQAETVSALIIPYNANRTYLMLQNKGASSVFLGFGREADAGSGFEIAGGGGFYEPILGTVSSVHGVSAAGIQDVTVVEGFRAQ